MTDSLDALALTHWGDRVARQEMTPGTASRYARVFASFVRFAAASGAALDEVDSPLCRSFIHARMATGVQPASSTCRFRLTVVRDAYRGFVAAGLVGKDPTIGLRVAQDPQHRTPAPLTPQEASRLRAAGRLSPRDYLRPVVVELALAGGSHAEIAEATVAHVNLATGDLRLGKRIVTLDPIARSTMSARVAACRRTYRRKHLSWDPDAVPLALTRPLAAYPPTSIAPSISSSLGRAMRSAGLTRPGLRPTSIREYAANRCYALDRRVESVAALLGLESLDAARGYIDQVWQTRYSEEVRARDGG
jgi:integrase